MAELSAADKRVLLGANYKEPEVTAESLAQGNAAKRASLRKVGIGIAVFAGIITLAILFGSQGILTR
jgi:hypothetical protein